MFNPVEHLSTIKTKNGPATYLRVQWRVAWFREQCPHGRIETSLIQIDTEKGYAIVRAVVDDGMDGIATAYGSETRQDFVDYLEKAETKSIGRALALLGYGTQFVSEQELNEGAVVDAPVAVAS